MKMNRRVSKLASGTRYGFLVMLLLGIGIALSAVIVPTRSAGQTSQVARQPAIVHTSQAGTRSEKKGSRNLPSFIVNTTCVQPGS